MIIEIPQLCLRISLNRAIHYSSSMVSKNRYHIQILCGKTLIVKAFSHRVLGGDILQKYLIPCIAYTF